MIVTAKAGKAREKGTGRQLPESHLWNPELPIFYANGEPYLESGDVEAQETWQFDNFGEWKDAHDLYYRKHKDFATFHSFYHDTRQVYIVTVAEKVEEGETATLTIDSFFELVTFSDVPIVNEYYKSIKAMHYNGDITTGIEEFAQWQQAQSGKLVPLDSVKEVVEAQIARCEADCEYDTMELLKMILDKFDKL